jgi:hypothetical protein
MFDRVFQIVGKKSVTPDGVVQYPVQDQLSGEFLTMSMAIEDSDALVPGAFLCHDTVYGEQLLVTPFQMSHWVSPEGTHGTKYPKIVDDRIMVLALSVSDISVILACWPLDEDL